MRFFGHIVRKNGMEERLMQGKVGGNRRRGRPATTGFQDLKDWTELDMTDASLLATGRERWRELIRVTGGGGRAAGRQGRRERDGCYSNNWTQPHL